MKRRHHLLINVLKPFTALILIMTLAILPPAIVFWTLVGTSLGLVLAITREFQEAFWPSYIATVLGVLVGIPVALWLSNLINAESELRRKKDEHQRLVAALQTIVEALDFNRSKYATILGASVYPPTSGLDVSAWDAVKSEVIPYLRDPALQGALAHHFGQLPIIEKLVQQLSTSDVHVVNHTLRESQLKDLVGRLSRGGDHLAQQVQDCMLRKAGNAPHNG